MIRIAGQRIHQQVNGVVFLAVGKPPSPLPLGSPPVQSATVLQSDLKNREGAAVCPEGRGLPAPSTSQHSCTIEATEPPGEASAGVGLPPGCFGMHRSTARKMRREGAALWTTLLWAGGAAWPEEAQAATLLVPDRYATTQAAVEASATDDTGFLSPGVHTGKASRNVEIQHRDIVLTPVAGAEQTIIVPRPRFQDLGDSTPLMSSLAQPETAPFTGLGCPSSVPNSYPFSRNGS
jgi:hypothetical protein